MKRGGPSPFVVLATVVVATLVVTGYARAEDPPIPRGFNFNLPLFPGQPAPWLARADSAAVQPDNAEQIAVTYKVMCGDTSDLYPIDDPPTMSFPYADVGFEDYTLPIFGAAPGTQWVTICDYDGVKWYPNPKWGVDTEGGPIEVPACAEVHPSLPAGLESDGHLILFNQESSTSYDFWQASTELIDDLECNSAGSAITGTAILETGYADFFDVREDGTNPEGVASARAMGTPLLAGMILPEDVRSGAINHALAVAIPGPRNTSPDPFDPLPADYFYPASTTETDYYSVNPYALAGGQRLRMKQTIVDESCQVIDEETLAPITRMWIRALRDYGLYIVDNASGFTFEAEDIWTGNLNMDDGDVAVLIGQPGVPLPANMTQWQVVIQTLNDEIWDVGIPFACGTCDAANSTVTTANFEVIENFSPDTGHIFSDDFETGTTDAWQ